MITLVMAAIVAPPTIAFLFRPIAEGLRVSSPGEAEDMGAAVLRLNEPPASWDMAAMDQEMPFPWEAGPRHILLWEVVRDGEEVAERCLVFKQYARPSDRGETCALGSLYRHPKEENPKWAIDMIHIAPDPDFKNPWGWRWGYACFKSLPTDKEIAAFLAEWRWTNALKPYVAFTLSDEDANHQSKVVERRHTPRLTDGGVNRIAWKEVFGHEPPVELFPADLFSELAVTAKHAIE
jgi:hypothetical protein